MKAIYLPLVALVGLTSCMGDIRVSDTENVDVKAITAEISKELKEELADISFADTIYATNYADNDTVVVGNDTIIHAGKVTRDITGVAVVKVEVPSVNVTIDPNAGIAEAQQRQQRTLINILGLVVPAATIAIVAIILCVFLYKRMRSRHSLIEQAIENGYQLPDAFYGDNSTVQPSGEQQQPGQYGTIPPLPGEVRMRDSGLKYCLIGVGMIIIFSVWGSEELAVIGVIPLLIGLGKLLTYFKIIK